MSLADRVPKSNGTGKVSLPLEIFELVIDELAADSTESITTNLSTLRACCLVCVAFVPLCRKHLFHDVTIGFSQHSSGPYTPSIHLGQLISTLPSISAYIHNVTYLFGPHDEEFDIPDDEAPLQPLLRLEKMQSLLIRCISRPMGGSGVVFSYDAADPNRFGCRSLLEQSLKSHTLTSVTLLHIDDVDLLAILSSPYLENLTIKSSRIKEWTSPPPLAALKNGLKIKSFAVHLVFNFPFSMLAFLSELECLEVGGFLSSEYDHDPNIVELLSPYQPAIFPKLRKLVTYGELGLWLDPTFGDRSIMPYFPVLKELDVNAPGDLAVFNRILGGVPALDTLTLRWFDRHTTGAHYQIDRCFLDSKAHLRRIDLIPHAFNHAVGIGSAITSLTNILMCLRNPRISNTIEEMNITLQIARLSHLPSESFPFDAWKPFDALFSPEAPGYLALPCLRQVSVVVVYGPPGPGGAGSVNPPDGAEKERFKAKLYASLPQLMIVLGKTLRCDITFNTVTFHRFDNMS